MSTSQETLFETYRKLLSASAGKWINAAGEVCYTYIDNGLSICKLIGEDNMPYISLYKIDSSGGIMNEITIKQSAGNVYEKFLSFYDRLRAKVEDERYSLLGQEA